MSAPLLLLPPPRLVWTTERSDIDGVPTVIHSCGRFALGANRNGVVAFVPQRGCSCGRCWRGHILHTVYDRDAFAEWAHARLPQSWASEVVAKLRQAWDEHWDLVLEDLDENWRPAPVHFLAAQELFG